MKSPARLNPTWLPLLATAAVLLALYTYGALSYKNFFSVRAVNNLFYDNSYLAIAAIGETFVILSGGIDLSVGAVLAFGTILTASLVGHGMHPVAAWLIVLASTTALGLVSGTLIATFDLPPFMVTLAGMFVARAGAFMVNDLNIGITHSFYTWLNAVRVPLGPRGVYLRLATMIMAASYVLSIIIAHFTPFGRYVYATGGDEHSALLLGVPVRRTKIWVYTLAGLCSGLAAVVSTIWKPSGDPAAFVGLELDVIAATVIGGTLLSGGVGFIAGTLLGIMIQGVIQMLIDFNGSISSWWTKITVGALLLAFIVVQRFLNARAARASSG